jgi:hypothetical protein
VRGAQAHLEFSIGERRLQPSVQAARLRAPFLRQRQGKTSLRSGPTTRVRSARASKRTRTVSCHVPDPLTGAFAAWAIGARQSSAARAAEHARIVGAWIIAFLKTTNKVLIWQRSRRPKSFPAKGFPTWCGLEL